MVRPQKVEVHVSAKDRETARDIVKWLRFFSLMYLILWIVMCTALFTLAILLFANR